MAYVFITNDNLKTLMQEQFINSLQSDFATRAEELELQNIELIKSKLAGKYDTAEIFAATGDDKSKLIIKCLCALVGYELTVANSARKASENLKNQYDWANKWLNDVRDGKETPDLPTATADEDANNIVHGSTQNNNWYL